MHKIRIIAVRCVLLALSLAPSTVLACPFCSTNGQETHLLEEIADVAVAALVQPVGDVPSYKEMLEARKLGAKEMQFEVYKPLRGDEELTTGTRFESKALGFFRADTLYLMTKSNADSKNPKFRPINSATADFLAAYVDGPPASNTEIGDRLQRLAFFIRYLDSDEQAVASTAIEELARAPYAEVKQLDAALTADEIIRRVETPKADSPAYGLHFLFLGLWGEKTHAPLMMQWLKSDNEEYSRDDIDGLMSAYLMLTGTEGFSDLLQVVDHPDKKRSKALSLSLMKALRFHTFEEQIFQKSDIISAYRASITNNHVAYWAIGELGRLEDWDALPLVWSAYTELKDSPNVDRAHKARLTFYTKNFLTRCPTPDAKDFLVRLQSDAA